MPLNVAYGYSDYFIWIQFVIDFWANHRVSWRLEVWDFPGHSDTAITLSYQSGHTYEFEVLPTNDTNVRFTIRDTAIPNNPWFLDIWVPSTAMQSEAAAFAPASAIEGYTSHSQLTNVPYFMTYVGYQLPAHFHLNDGFGIPSGIGTKVWYAGDHYYWAMLDHSYMTNASGFQYGYGWVDNPAGLNGDPNNNWAYMYEPFEGSTGYIIGDTNIVAGGEVWVYARTAFGIPADLILYASYDGLNWDQIGMATVTLQVPQWIYIGTFLSGFKHIAAVGYNTGDEIELYLDAVWIGNFG